METCHHRSVKYSVFKIDKLLRARDSKDCFKQSLWTRLVSASKNLRVSDFHTGENSVSR